MTIEEQFINELVETHWRLWSYEDTGLVQKGRTRLMRRLVELELAAHGHSLKGLRLK